MTIRMLIPGTLAILLIATSPDSASLYAEDAQRGVVLPITVSGGLMLTDRAQPAEPQKGPLTAGFRAVYYPGLRLSPHWYVSSTIQTQSKPYFYYDAFYSEDRFETRVQQLFLAYNWSGESASLRLKAGQLNSAFGYFPTRYSDKVNSLLDQPFAYGYVVKLRPDQNPCSVRDLLAQQTYPSYVEHYCGGATRERNGMIPVTLNGLPGAEVSASWKRIDGRFQLTNSSPANPQSLRSHSQHVQWAAGAGFTIRQGFRVGASAFQGPFLERDVVPLLPAGIGVRDYPASAAGIDLQWARGRWRTSAEWNRITFNYPRFRLPPAESTGYAEVKTILTPRFYAAARAGVEAHSSVEDLAGNTAGHFMPNRKSYEFAVGYHLNPAQTLRIGYEWLKENGRSGTRDNVFGVQVVTSINRLSKAF